MLRDREVRQNIKDMIELIIKPDLLGLDFRNRKQAKLALQELKQQVSQIEVDIIYCDED